MYRAFLERADGWALAAWHGVFRACGFFRRPLEELCPRGGERILAIAPHPDDEALGCGGTLARHVLAGDTVAVAIVTDGRRSRSGGRPPSAMARLRRKEAEHAAGLLGIDRLVWMGLREGEWGSSTLTAVLRTLLDDFRPDVVYAPCWLDYHPEHRKVARCLAAVVSDSTTIRIYTLHVPLGFLENLAVDVTCEEPLIRELFASYASQERSLLRGLRLRRYAASLRGPGVSTELFCEAAGASYRRAHLSLAGVPAVRGMRYRAFGDVLSYVLGGQARRSLSRLLRP